jgi:hypothetical protein
MSSPGAAWSHVPRNRLASATAPQAKKIGHACRKWAFAEAAVLWLRHNAKGQKALARVEHKPGKGKALTILAQTLARAVYSRLQGETVGEMDKIFQSERSRAGEPGASLGTRGISRHRACCKSYMVASLNAKARLGRPGMDPVRAERMSKELRGKRVGGWLIRCCVGSGKSAVVFKAETDDQQSALKVFEPNSSRGLGKLPSLGESSLGFA